MQQCSLWLTWCHLAMYLANGSCPGYSSRPHEALLPSVQAELERLESGRSAGPSGHQHAAHDSATDGVAAAAVVYFRKLGHLASCAANLR